jgi:acylphosphatase
MYKAVSITIKGRVQGVGFRYSACSIANNLEIKGFVKNNYDGSVYIEAEGKDDNLSEFIQWCRTGPPHAYVSTISTIELTPRKFSSFEVKH